jgi:hypothetical protein
MVYKSIKKQRKFQREYKYAIRHGQKFRNPFKGMEKLCTQKVKRKSRLMHGKRRDAIRGSF